MSYRELRNFCEIMRSLGYPRTISMENFRIPNFKLVAEITYWLIKRFDPKADVPDSIEEERDRVEFIRSACQFFYSNLKVKIDSKKLYSSDGYSVQELIKVASILYKAKKTTYIRDDYDNSNELDITSRKQDIKQIKTLSEDIVETGLNLLDLLEKEKILKENREKAIDYLDNLTKNSDSKKEQEQIEKRIIDILQNQQNTLEQLDTHLIQLKNRTRDLEEEIKIKSIELERSEKRLESIKNARPAHYGETRALEAELAHVYKIYVEKIRNHDFLSSQLETYLKIEEDNRKNRDEQIKSLKKKIKEYDNIMLNDENEELNGEFEGGEDFYENYQQEALNKNNFRNGTSGNMMHKFAKEGEFDVEGEIDQEEEEEEESDGF